MMLSTKMMPDGYKKMNFDYEGWLYNAIYQVITGLRYDIKFKIAEEQMFVKDKDKQPDVLYIVYKQMTGPNSFGVATIPYNILIMSEQNQLEIAKNIANKPVMVRIKKVPTFDFPVR